MKFTAQINELQSALPKVAAVIPSRSALAQLENIQLELKSKSLTMMATDLEISVRSTIEVVSKTDGVVTIPSRRFSDLIGSLPSGELSYALEKSTRKVSLKAPSGNYNFTASESGDLPDMMQEFKPETSTKTTGAELKKMISSVLFAASSNEFRVAMMGVLFQFSPDGTTTVATDGHRLVKVTSPDLKTDTERDVIVPSKALNLVLKSFADDDEVAISCSQQQIEFKNSVTSILTRLIDEQYPNYEAVIPRENEKLMTISRPQLLASMNRVMKLADSESKQIRFQLSKNSLGVYADTIEEGADGDEHISCDYDHDDLTIGFNGKFIQDGLSHLDVEDVTIKFSTPTRAAIIEPATQGKQEILMLVMPVRLNA